MSNYILEIGDLVTIRQKIHDGYYLEKFEEFTALIVNVNQRLFQKGDGAYLTPQQQNLLETFDIDKDDGFNFITIRKLFEKLVVFIEQKKNRFVFINEITCMRNTEIATIFVYSTLDNLVAKTNATGASDNFRIKCIKSKSKNPDKLKRLNKFLNRVPQVLMNAAKKRFDFLIFLRDLHGAGRNEFSSMLISDIEKELCEYENFVEHYEAMKLNIAIKMGKSRKNKFDNRRAETIKKKYDKKYIDL